MNGNSTGVCVAGIDRERNTVYLTVNGCRVTAVCEAESRPEIYESVKAVLIESVVGNVREFDKKQEI